MYHCDEAIKQLEQIDDDTDAVGVKFVKVTSALSGEKKREKVCMIETVRSLSIYFYADTGIVGSRGRESARERERENERE